MNSPSYVLIFFMTDYVQEQEMEIEALKAILMDEFEVQLGLVFSHTLKYPDEIPLLNLRSIKGISASDLTVLKEKLEQEASENLGMAMIYSLVTSSKEWVTERFAHDASDYDILEETANKDEIIVPHGEPVTIETFLVWREKFEAELALERAKLLPESALVTTKEKKLTGKQWFESGRASKRVAPIIEGSNDEDEEIDFDDDDDDNDNSEGYYFFCYLCVGLYTNRTERTRTRPCSCSFVKEINVFTNGS
ncbi:putative RWD domain-containing protein [Helianthus anomalus]